MDTDLSKLYPTTSGKVSIKALSDGRYLIHDRKTNKTLLSNEDLGRILEKCDGSNSVKDIGHKIINEPNNAKDILDKIKKALLQLQADRIVFFKTQKTNVPIRLRKNKLQYPLNSVYLEPTRRCNFRCIHCYAMSPTITAFQKQHEMAFEQYLGLIDRLDEIGVMAIYITGGEPFLRKDTMEILKYIDSKGIRHAILTNGSLLDDETIIDLKNVNPSYVSVSVDDYREEQFEKIRGKGMYKKVLKNVRKLVSAGLEVQINSVVFRGLNDSYEDFKEFMNFFKKEGIHPENIAFDEFVPQGEGRDKAYFRVNEMETMMSLKKAYREVFSRKIRSKDIVGENHVSDTFCGLGKETCYIKSNGDVTLCPGLSEEGYKIGNVLTRDISKIWESPSGETIKYLRKKEYLENCVCLKCEFLDECFGGCKARSMVFFNKFNAPDPWMCAYFKDEQSFIRSSVSTGVDVE